VVRAGCFGRSPPGLLVEDRLDLRVVDVALVVPILTTLLVDRVFFRSSSGPAGTGSGVAATQARSVPPYTGVDLAGDNNVIVQVGARQSVIVHADSNLLRRVTTRVRSGRLVIGTTPGNLSAKCPMFVAVSLPSLDRLRLQGDGNISATAINSRNLTVALPGSGNVHATGARRDDQRRGNRSAAPAHGARRESRAKWRREHHGHRDAESHREGLRQRHDPLSRQPPHVTQRVSGSGTISAG
jgi:hypothetical protein